MHLSPDPRARSRRALLPAMPVVLLLLGSCTAATCGGGERGAPAPGRSRAPGPTAEQIAQGPAHGLRDPSPRVDKPSESFVKQWRDGKAELSAYATSTVRYGEMRRGRTVLVYVTEPMDSRVWIKDDADKAPPGARVEVLKLNHTLRFRTGIYPYSVMTSVFSPVQGTGRERFAPAKVSLSVQEWCGHVYHQIHPKGDRFHSQIHSYFGSEGDAGETVRTGPGTLYEDALWIQLRELDGAFNSGKDWSGELVPGLWQRRKAHRPLRPVDASITRTDAAWDGRPTTRFVLKYGDFWRQFDVEKAAPRRILAWRTSLGEASRILGTARLPYWELNHEGDEKALEKLGLDPVDPDSRARQGE